MSQRKKGVATPGTDIAALVLLIALFIIGYILLIPEAEREAILEGNPNYVPGDGGYYPGGPIEGISLLSAIPGKLYPFEKNTITKEFPPALLFTRQETITTPIATRVEVSKTPFSEQTRTYTFSADRIQDVTSAKMFFFIEEGDGTFFVELNGQTIFEQELGTQDIPIELPLNALKANNQLKIGVRGRLWEGYTLRDIAIKFDRAYDNTLVRRNFELTSNERNAIEKATLSYYLNCIRLNQNSFITVILNERILKSDVVFCDVGESIIELPRERLRTGTNTIEFRIDQGDYELQDLELELKTGSATYPTYNFEVDDDVYFDLNTECFTYCRDDCYDICRNDNDCFDACLDDCDIACDRGEVVLEVRFAELKNERIKKGAITINEYQINFNTNGPLYTRSISDTLRRGNNVIKIIPQSDMEIIDLRVVFIR